MITSSTSAPGQAGVLMVKVTTQDRIAAADGRFSRIRQAVLVCPAMWAHCHHLANMIELALPSAHPSPQPKRQIDGFSHFCTAHCKMSLYFTMRCALLVEAKLGFHLTKSPGPRPTSVPSVILIHPAVWPQRTWAENWGLCPFWGSWVTI